LNLLNLSNLSNLSNPMPSPFSVTAAKVIAIEVIVVTALWLAGQYFSG
jgi:hypothetical protein